MALSNKVVISVSPAMIPVTVSNGQNVASQAGTQVMVQLSSSNLQPILGNVATQVINNNFANLRFLYNGSLVRGWVESISNGVAVVWIRIPVSIPASSSVGLELVYSPKYNYDGQYWGIAPQLSSTYGEYDNGASVFNFYDNFAGTTLSSKWVANGASYTINNGLNYTEAVNYNVLDSATSFTAPYIIEYYGKGTAVTEDGGTYFNIQSQATNSNSYLWAQRGSEGSDEFYTYISGSYTGYRGWAYSIDGNMHVYTLVVGPSDNPLITMTDYIQKEDFTSMPSTYTSGYFGPRGTGTYWQWVRVRAYPPNGVIPSVTIGD